MTLHIVPDIPKPAPKAKVRRAAKPADMLQCHRCEGREVIVSTIGVLIQGGKLKGGTKQVLCVGCLLKGERVVLA